jgi:hypothetical protein
LVTGEDLESLPELLVVRCSADAAPLLRSGAEPMAPEERGREPLKEVERSSAEYVGRTGTMGDRQHTLNEAIKLKTIQKDRYLKRLTKSHPPVS